MSYSFWNKFRSKDGRKWIFWLGYERLLRLAPWPNLRGWLLKLGGAKLGDKCFIHDVIFMNVYVNGFKNLRIGNNSTIQTGGLLDLANPIIIGDNVTVGPRVSIFTHSDCGVKMGKPLAKYFPRKDGAVGLSDGCWIGACASIFEGVSIGECAVVAAGSIVKNSVIKRTIVAGIPAKAIDRIPAEDF